MRLTPLIAGAAAMATLGWAGSASAQVVEFYYGPPAGYVDYYYGYDYPRAYYYEAPAPRVIRRGGCGTYRYWNGDRCVDARYD